MKNAHYFYFLQTITMCGYDGSEFSEHSNKRGGASYAAEQGMADAEICEIGDWKNIETARLYIEPSSSLSQKKVKRLQNAI